MRPLENRTREKVVDDAKFKQALEFGILGPRFSPKYLLNFIIAVHRAQPGLEVDMVTFFLLCVSTHYFPIRGKSVGSITTKNILDGVFLDEVYVLKFDNTKNRARGRDKIISRAFPAWYGIALLMYIKLIRPKPDEECEEVFIDCQRRRPIASLDFRAYIHSKYNEYKALTFGDSSPPQYVGYSDSIVSIVKLLSTVG